MSPEITMDLPYTLKSDIWSLGCVLYEMCSFTFGFYDKDNNIMVSNITKGIL